MNWVELEKQLILCKQQLAAKDALLRQLRHALDELNKADDDRDFMNGGEIVMVAIAIEAIDKELGK